MTASVPLPVGFSLISNPHPEGGPISLLPPNGLGFPVRNGSAIYQWNCGGSFTFNQFFDGAWEGDGGGATPTVDIGEAFYFYNPGSAFQWTRSFTVGP